MTSSRISRREAILALVFGASVLGVVLRARSNAGSTPIVSPPGRAAHASGSVIDVKDFGATGDGQRNDHDSIQHALDAAARGGESATVRIGPGTYRIDDELKVSSPLSIKGTASTVLTAGPLVQSLLTIMHSKGVRVQSLSFVGTHDTPTMLNCILSSVTIDDCRFANAKVSGVRLNGGNRVRISRCSFSETNRGIFGSPNEGEWLSDVQISDCTFLRMRDACACFIGSNRAATNRVSISQCTGGEFLHEGTTRSGFYWVSAGGVRHSGINLSRCQIDGLHQSFRTQSGNSDFVTFYDVEHSRVDGCTVVGGGDIGISVYRSSDVSVIDNSVHDNQSAGISIWDSTHCVVKGNQVFNNRRAYDHALYGVKGGILCRGMTSDVVIEGNRCYDDQVHKTQDFGVSVETPCRNVRIISNRLEGNSQGEIKNAGQDTLIIGSQVNN
jgi:parallel beta-helix repeat protein